MFCLHMFAFLIMSFSSTNCQLICHHAKQNKVQTLFFVITIFYAVSSASSHLWVPTSSIGCNSVMLSRLLCPRSGRLWYVLMLFHLLPGITLLPHCPQQILTYFPRGNSSKLFYETIPDSYSISPHCILYRVLLHLFVHMLFSPCQSPEFLEGKDCISFL